MSTAILVIEDEPDLRKLLRVVLERADFVVHEASDGGTGLREFHDQRPDLVLLDVGLPTLDGWHVLQRIREMSEVPVLLLTARGLESEKVRGLQSGADDYVTKPFGREELLARIRATLRRSGSGRGERVEAFDDGRLRMDFVGRRVWFDNAEVTLTPTEHRLLVALARHCDKVLSPQQLLELAWDDPAGIGPDRVKFTVLRVRRKLGIDTSDSSIEAVRGFGYRYRRADRPV